VLKIVKPTLLCVLLLTPGPAAAETLRGEIRFAAADDAPVCVGEQKELHLELWSNGFRFGEQRFLTPEVPGAFLLHADASTVKLTETRGGETWQGLRYTFLLYPQLAGHLDVPGFDVQFSADTGFASQPKAFSFRTPVVTVEARLPPGARQGLLVSTSEFTLSAAWKPVPPAEGTLELRVGDALTLEVNRRARDVPGMVFAPLPEFGIDGLAAYPALAQVNDSMNRGSLTGERRDSLTLVCEREGRFEIPSMAFQWWDPRREVLQTEVIEGMTLEVAANPAFATAPPGTSPDRGRLPGKWLLAIVFLAGLVMAAWRWMWPPLAGWWRQRQAQRRAGERWAFRQVRAACAGGAPAQAYQAITLWLSRLPGAPAGLTLIRLADSVGDEHLRQEAVNLQRAVAGEKSSGWSGHALLRELEEVRAESRRKAARPQSLPPLNPRGSE
jgi:hypothetical protein